MKLKPGAWAPWTLYDTEQVDQSAGQTLVQFFAQPRGAAGKDEHDTNLSQARQLPSNERFLVKQIILRLWPAVIESAGEYSIVYADAIQMLPARSHWELKINGDVALEGVLAMVVSGAGWALGPDAAGLTFWHELGTADPRAVFSLRKIVEILPGESFEVNVEWPACPVDADDYVCCALRGMRKLPTQQAA